MQSTSFTLTNNSVNGYQWQLSIDGGSSWSTILNNTTYSGATSGTLTISNLSPSMSGYQYRVSLTKNGNTCGLISASATLTVYALPVVTLTPVTLVQCDDNTDGITDFNLAQKNNVISSNYLNETFTYYTSLAGANTASAAQLIATPLAYTTSNSTVWARVQNANGCFRTAQINLIVSVTNIPNTFNRKFSVCDDYLDMVNNDRDGISLFNFSSVNADILALLPTGTAYNIKYYRNQADALAETDAAGNSLAITNISSYRNIGYPNAQTIWVRVDSTILNACYGYGPYINLKVDALPTAFPVNATNIIRHCDDDQDGVYGFTDSAAIQSAVLGNQSLANVNVKYYDNVTGNLLPSPLPNPYNVTGTQTIRVRVTNNATNPSVTPYAPCFDEKTFQFIVDDLPEAFTQNIPTALINRCDDEVEPSLQNGSLNFDTTTFNTTILNGQTGMQIEYFAQNGSSLGNQMPNPFVSGTTNVTVKVTNLSNNSCPASKVIAFVVNPLPKVNLNANGQANQLVCSNIPTFSVTIDAGITDGTATSNYTYQWYKDAVLMIGETNYTLNVNLAATYTVNVAFNATPQCFVTRSVVVTASDIALIQNIEIVDLADTNSANIIATGLGVYVYSLDNSAGNYQASPFFTNLDIGLHTIYIKDLNGCGIMSKDFYVLGVPKYFTPNGDGFNDFWNVKGIEPSVNGKTIIHIFDRFGKLIKQISPLSQGWDGTYNTVDLPSEDYWYSIKFEDGRSAKGHFSLKR